MKDQAALAQVIASNRLAEALMVGFAHCEGNNRPLTDLQKGDLIASALLAFDGSHADTLAHLELHQALTTRYACEELA